MLILEIWTKTIPEVQWISEINYRVFDPELTQKTQNVSEAFQYT